MTNKNNQIKIHERLTALETNDKDQNIKLDCIEKKLDDVRLTIEKWKGTFGLISSIGGLVGGAIITIIIKLLFH